MKISQIIDRLEKIKAARGDLEVEIYDEYDKFPIDRISLGFIGEDRTDLTIVIQSPHGGWSDKDDA